MLVVLLDYGGEDLVNVVDLLVRLRNFVLILLFVCFLLNQRIDFGGAGALVHVEESITLLGGVFNFL